MSAGYQPILWNRFKIKYDLFVWASIVLYLAVFIGYNFIRFPHQNLNTILIRAFGTLAFILLHLVLLVGPVCRLSNKFLPILYNRRHLGVSLFIIAAVHAVLSLIWFHSNTDTNPLVSLFTANRHYGSIAYFPFQTLGFAALIILAAMAFTSHDFWLSFLGPSFWKSMHMLVYLAYALIIAHVVLGIIQFEKSPVLVILLLAGLLLLSTVHILAAIKESRADNLMSLKLNDDWEYVCKVEEIEEGLAKVVNIDNERVAIFKYNGMLSAVHNVCKHQMGPLGEGKIVDGCITCPWHGYQYRPEDGCAPPPFNEKLQTYPLQLIGNKIYVSVKAMAEGTYIEPIIFSPDNTNKNAGHDFFVGWHTNNKKSVLRTSKKMVIFLVPLLILTAFVLTTQQERISTFQIDYEHVKELQGWLTDKPVPMLTIADGKDKNGNPLYKSILLVDAFKKGADDIVEKELTGADSKYVKLTGYLSNNYISCGPAEHDSNHECLSRCTQCITGTTQFPLMEIENGNYSFSALASVFDTPAMISTERIDTFFNGEIVDPKCYFGAMNPGQGKTHLSCAVRCIGNGIMPMIKYAVSGQENYALLLGEHGERINMQLLNVIGLPLRITGRLSRFHNWQVLYINPRTDIIELSK